VLPVHGGRLVKHLGDGMLLAFEEVPRAVAAAVQLGELIEGFNAGCDAQEVIRLRTGINVCDVVLDELDALGHGVNVAARVAAHADPGRILMTAEVNEQLHPALDVETEDLGDVWLKHLEEPVRVYVVHSPHQERAAPVPPATDTILRPAVAIVPFDMEGASPSGLSIGDLIADELICALSALPDLQVVSRLSTSVLAERGEHAAGAGSALQADYVLMGTCRTAGDRLLLHAQLFDSRRAEVLDVFRRTATVPSLLADDSPLVLQLVADVTGRILERQVELARRCALPNLAGYTLLLGGISLMHRLSRRDFQRAHELLQHLCERWPRLAAPHAWMARWRMFNVMQGWSSGPEGEGRAAQADCDRALDLDPESSVALTVAGSVRIGLTKDVDGGMALYERALQCNPNDPFAWLLLGTAHAFKGDGKPATSASAQAIRLSPLDPMHFLYDCHAAGTLLVAGDYAAAVARAQRSLRANSQHLSTYRVLAIGQQLGGDAQGAQATVRRLLALDPAQSVEGFLRTSASAAYAPGKRFAAALAEAGLPAGAR
jgi:TolB-like protein